MSEPHLRHETRTALPPVEGSVIVCSTHHETIKDIFAAIDKGNAGKMSRGQVMWSLGVLMVVAFAWGGTVWGVTSASTSKNEENIVAMDRRVLTLELKWQQVQEQLNRIEAEAKLTRAETNQQLEGLRRTLEKKP